jgi:hypothetical protein
MSPKRLIAIGLLCAAPPVLAQRPPPSLGTAASFAVLAPAVTSSGPTIVTGNLGGNSIHGFPPGVVLLGTTLHNGEIAGPLRDAAAAYDDLAGRTCNRAVGGDNLSPGIYCATPFTSQDPLTLDANGDPNAVWIFRLSAGLTTPPASAIRVINGGWEGNVFWQVDGFAVLGNGAVFIGNILASKGITLGAGANLSGRALVLDGSVTLSGNRVTLCCHNIIITNPSVISATEALPFKESFTQSGAITPVAFRLASGVLPAGLTLGAGGTLSGTPTQTGTFPITVQATDSTPCAGTSGTYILTVGCPLITISPETLPPPQNGVPYFQTLTVNGGTPPYTFAVTGGRLPDGLALTPDNGAAALTATLSGTAAFTEGFVVRITVTDAAGCVAIPAISPWGLVALSVILVLFGVKLVRDGGS